MALPTFAPPVAPSPGTKSTPRISLYEAEFGDGYSQSSPKGLNHIRSTVELNWEGLVYNEMHLIRTFFEDRAGYKSFYFQPAGYAAAVKWLCKEWNFGSGAPYTFTAKLEQSFTNES